MIAGAGAFALVVVVAGATFAVGLGNDTPPTVASHPDHTTTEAPSTTTTVAPTSTTVPAAVTPSPGTNPGRPANPTAPVATSTSSTTVPGIHGPDDWTALSTTVDTPGGSLTIASGGSATLEYTVTNNGSWTVGLHEPDCPWRSLTWTLTPGWPQGSAVVSPCFTWHTQTLAPGTSIHYTDTVHAAWFDSTGKAYALPPAEHDVWIPRPWQYYNEGAGTNPLVPDPVQIPVEVVIAAPETYSVTPSESSFTVAPGAAIAFDAALTNNWEASYSLQLPGPCPQSVDTQAVQCTQVRTPAVESGRLDPGSESTIAVGPHQTRQLAFTVYATATLTVDGAPLAPGTYAVRLADHDLTLVVP